MTKDEALRMALEALETYHGYMEPLLTVFGGPRVPAEQSTTWKVEQAITAIKEALAQPPEERNFCPRCGKRAGKNDWDVHTCTPPEKNT